MLWTLVVLLAGVCSADYSVRCSDRAKSWVSVSAATDGTAGRYIVEYCTAVDPTVTKWQLVMSTLHQSPQNCTYDILQERFSGTGHSHSVEEIETLNVTCPQICFSKPMDLMFRSCYRLENTLYRGQISSEPYNSYYYADNNITWYHRDSTPQFVTDIDYDSSVSFHWFEGHIPITDYEITVWPNDTHSEETMIVTRNCSREVKSVQCVLYLPLGCYILQLKHIAPWTKGLSHLQFCEGTFCHTGVDTPSLGDEAGGGARVGAAVWAAGGALVLLAAGGALLALRLSRRAKRQIGKIVQQAWINSTGEPEKAVDAGAGGPILLLYARDCAPALRLAHALRDLLEEVAPGQVWEVHSKQVTALAARAPAAWLRSVLLAPSVRVVLLQTPALPALHRAATHADIGNGQVPKLEEPLLGGRAVYAAPQFGDTLLQYALQLLGETAHAQPHPPYKKYFLATVSDLPVDMFPTIVPYTRYELPAASGALARALRPDASASETAIADLAHASCDLVEYARENPHYLSELLVYL